jgi:hypothetical protein
MEFRLDSPGSMNAFRIGIRSRMGGDVQRDRVSQIRSTKVAFPWGKLSSGDTRGSGLLGTGRAWDGPEQCT